MRPFWLADGSYRARATNSAGSITYFDQQTILAIGASSGAAPSGGVDPSAIYQTGDVMWLDRQGSRTGWVRDNGRTMGSATSGSAERANSDAQPLFEFLWNNFSNAICPVVSGRGASSLADWTANKQITLPDKRGFIAGGLDDMGSTAAGNLAGVPIITGGVTTPGSLLGETLHTTSVAEMPAHTHTGTTAVESAHTHPIPANPGSKAAPAGAGNNLLEAGSGQNTGAGTPHSHTFTTDNTGSGTAHNNVQRTVLGTFYRKL